MKRTIKDLTPAELLRRLKNKEPYSHIARDYNCTDKTIATRAGLWGLKQAESYATKADDDLFRADFAAGLSDTELAKKYGRTIKSICNRRWRLGLLRKAPPQCRNKSPHPCSNEDPAARRALLAAEDRRDRAWLAEIKRKEVKSHILSTSSLGGNWIWI